MSLFGQYEIIKNENSLLTCKDTTNKYLIETNMNNSFYDESLNIIKQDNVIIMPYYEHNLIGLYKQFPQLINADNVKCIIQLLLEKLKEMDNKEMKFATTNIFITEKLEIKILPINIEYDVECISTFFMSNVAIIAVELMLHENTERNIQLKDILYNGILDPRIKEITGDDLYTIIDNLYNGRNVQLNVDLAEFTYLIKSVVFGIEVVKPKVTVINAKSLQTNSCTGTVCVEAKCNFVNIKCDDNLNERYIDEKNSPDSSAIIDKINILDVKPIITEVPVTKKQMGMVVINEEIVSKKKYTITTLNKNLFEIENAHHANVKKEEIAVNDTKTPTRENLDNEIRKGRFLVKQNQPLSIFNKDNMNKMKQIIEKQKKLIAYLKRDTTKYKNEIKKLEDELKDLGCIVEEETYSKGATC